MKFLDELNPQQKEAVLHGDGPLLILAGAGSGKTRTVTSRIAYLIKKRGVKPDEILAVTFTNKAAREMRQRVEETIKGPTRGMWISTFHSACARILRDNIGHLGYSKNFNILDSGDSVNLIKSCMKDLNISERLFSPRDVSGRISTLKAGIITPDEYRATAQPFGFESKVSKIYPVYQDRLKGADSLDFDDLLMLTVILFKKHGAVLKGFQETFKHILVDEYQDTNQAQYHLIRLLAGKGKNVCVVGDDDQSIYSFRGADMRNILEFEKDYPSAKVVKLEQNYRSTQRILDAAWSLVCNNPGRKQKKLWSELGAGDKVSYLRVPDEEAEASQLAQEIKKCVADGRSYADIAVLYRTNTQARTIEESLRKASVPYRVVGGMKFYDRKEIKDLISYLKTVSNPKDTVSLKRIVNTPPRGIGETTIKKASALTQPDNLPLVKGLEMLKDDSTLTSGPKKSIGDFLDMMGRLAKAKARLAPRALAERVLAETRYLEYIKESLDLDAQGKIDNIKEFLDSLTRFEETTENPLLEDYLTQVALVADWDTAKADTPAITLMTLHLSKGLEFPVVFITGVEEGLIPHSHSQSDDSELEEERRLLYVGMTRARERLYLMNAMSRKLAGLTQSNRPSRFIEELPEKLVDIRKAAVPRKPIATAAPGRAVYAPPQPRSPMGAEARSPYRSGSVVSHPVWGNGIVEKTEGRGEDLKITVLFKSVGKKKLMAKFAGLTMA